MTTPADKARKGRRGRRPGPPSGPVRLAWLLAASCAVPAAAADILVAANGERLSGRVVERVDGVIVFDSDAFGRIRVAEGQASVERAPVPASPAIPTEPAAPARANPWSWDLGVKVGADRGSLETHENELDLTLRLVRTGSTGELHGRFGYGYTRTEGVLKDDDFSASLSYDRWLSDAHFVSGRVIGSSDLVDGGHDVTRTLSAAYGWRLFETPDRYLRIGPALGYLWLERGDEAFSGAALGLHARAKGPVVGAVSLSAEMQYLDSFDDGRYANLDLRLLHPLTERLQLALTWRYLWSDVAIESGITSEWRWEIIWRPRPDGGQ